MTRRSNAGRGAIHRGVVAVCAGVVGDCNISGALVRLRSTREGFMPD
ncbi:MAG: hypothetical protein AB7F23_07250 [Phycisphaerae bacterium]